MPLSGDVTQAINPWSWTFGAASSQAGLVNSNLGRSSDPELEQELLDEVGSYGMQLGRIGDALAVLIRARHFPIRMLIFRAAGDSGNRRERRNPDESDLRKTKGT
ncbi:MAG: hypothetical protein JNK80_09330 [Dechloromonas sp.]|nr:hypothetical protein [Dechloromonas sp.]